MQLEKKWDNFCLTALMLVLGVTPLLDNGYHHWIMFLDAAVIGAAVLLAARRGVGARWEPVGAAFFFGLVLLTAAGAFWAVEPHGAVTEAVRLALYLGVYYLASSALNREEVRRLHRLLVLVISLIAAAGLLLFVVISSGRIESTFINANPLGIYLAIGFFLALYPYMEHEGRGYLAAAVLIGSAVILTGSRGSMLAALLPLLFTVYFWLKRGAAEGREHTVARRLLTVGVLVLVTVLLLTTLAPWVQGSFSEELLSTRTAQNLISSRVIRANNFLPSSVAGRVSFWQVAAKEWLDHPLTGVGGGNYHNAYFTYWNQDRFYSRFAHNQYLQVLAETGLFGAVFFTGALLLVFWRMWRQRDGSSMYMAWLAAAAAFLLHIGIDFSWSMPAVTFTFWALAGMASAWSGAPAVWGRRWMALLALPMLLVITLQFTAWQEARHGAVLEAEEQYLAAVEQYQSAIRFYPLRQDYWSRLSYAYDRLYRTSGRDEYLKQARAALRRALELNPGSYYLQTVAAAYLLEEGREEEAEAAYRRAIEIGGFYPKPYRDLGYYYLGRADYRSAAGVFEKGLDWFPDSLRGAPGVPERVQLMRQAVDMHLGLAQALEKLGQQERAWKQRESAGELLKKIARLTDV